MPSHTFSKKHFLYTLLTIILIGTSLFFAYKYKVTFEEKNIKETEISLLQEKLSDFEADIARREVEKNELQNSLLAEQEKINAISDQFEDLTDTVGTLEKLSKTDKELLQKYSKVAFLNEHYIPEDLSEIKKDFVWNQNTKFEIHSKVRPFLEDMLEEAASDGINLLVASAYRSFDSQKSLKSNYIVRYGTGANAFSADQGFSEHQLGTTLDFTTKELGANFSSFEITKAFTWLQEYAHSYGFVLSYPKGNKYYIFEPWHWRFVGEKLAKKLHRENKFFYDLDQRTIDEYLVNIFD